MPDATHWQHHNAALASVHRLLRRAESMGLGVGSWEDWTPCRLTYIGEYPVIILHLHLLRICKAAIGYLSKH
jgi:hypothetical protein